MGQGDAAGERHRGGWGTLCVEWPYDLASSPATIQEVLVRHRSSASPVRRRGRHKPERCGRRVLGKRVQVNTGEICLELYQYAATDRVLDEMPSPIRRLQTGRGAEFLAEAVQRRPMEWAVKFRSTPRARRP
jgi:hypothetical protein